MGRRQGVEPLPPDATARAGAGDGRLAGLSRLTRGADFEPMASQASQAGFAAREVDGEVGQIHQNCLGSVFWGPYGKEGLRELKGHLKQGFWPKAPV